MDAPKVVTSLDGVFGGTYRHQCLAGMSGINPCTNVMVVPDPETPGAPKVLTEGQVWACASCGARHEYYIIRRGGVREGCVKLLHGVDRRGADEPTVTEFMEAAK